MRRAVALLAIVLGVLWAAAGRAAPPRPRGFTSYGDPMFEEVFPDSAGVRRWVDQLGTVHDRMEGLRVDFSKAVQLTLGELNRTPAPKGAKRCQQLAPSFARAHELGQRYLTQGRDLARVYDLLTRLDEMGESVGLTPDYRARVKRVREVYRGLRNDYREMKYAFYEELVPELQHVGCEPDALLALAAADSRPAPPTSASAPAPATTLPRAPVRRAPTEAPPRPATMITFHVDNTTCPRAVRVSLDGNPLGTIDGHARRGYRTRSGPHQLCLLREGSQQKCGQPGTLRRGYLHEGWTIQLKCPK